MSPSDDSKTKDIGLLILRLGIGFMFIFYHGWPKLTGGPAMWKQLGQSMELFGVTSLPGMWGLASGIVEFIGGILMVFGLFFRPATFLLTINMFVASVTIISTGRGMFTYPVEVGILMLSLIFIGPGEFSIDQWRANRKYYN